MNNTNPTITVIISTHNRCDSLRRTLVALCDQSYAFEQMEVLVIADGCTDDTVEMANSFNAPFAMRVFEQEAQGLAAARNRGANYATGKLLLFLDDDIVPSPKLIDAHVRSHEEKKRSVIIGYYPTALDGKPDYISYGIWATWERMFKNISTPGHRFCFKEILFGNSSIDAEFFKKTGGFDTSFRAYGREDWEFGARLIKAGAKFYFSPEAIGYHYPTIDPKRALRQKRSEARADVKIGILHPDLKPLLPMNSMANAKRHIIRIARFLSIRWSKTFDSLVNAGLILLRILEHFKFRRHWEFVWEDLCIFCYWRGIIEELGSDMDFDTFIEQVEHSSIKNNQLIDLDLSMGLQAAEQILEEERPRGTRFFVGDRYIGTTLAKPGYEYLTGIHLLNILATELSIPYLRALALEGVIGNSLNYRQFNALSPKEVRSWINELHGQEKWLRESFCSSLVWQKLEEEPKSFWKRQAKIKELEIKKKRLEEERAYWQQIDEHKECSIKENTKAIDELELGIRSLKTGIASLK